MTTSESATPKRLKWWQSQRAIWSARVVIAITAIFAVVWWFEFHPYVSTDDARVAATLVRIAPQSAGGLVVKVNVTEGDRVKKDDVLVELDHRVAQADFERAKARAELTASDLKRAELLSAQRGLAKRDLDRAKSDAVTADADLQLAQVALDNTFLKSTLDGVVVQKLAEPGDILGGGQSAVTVADIDHAWVAANIEETSIGDVKTGQAVSISIDEGGSLTGHVQEIRVAAASEFALIPAENAAGNFTKLVQRIPIKVALEPHPEKTLRAGESVEIKIRVR